VVSIEEIVVEEIAFEVNIEFELVEELKLDDDDDEVVIEDVKIEECTAVDVFELKSIVVLELVEDEYMQEAKP